MTSPLVKEREIQDPILRLEAQEEYAWIMHRKHRPELALELMRGTIDIALSLSFAYRNGLNFVAEDYLAILAGCGDLRGATRLLGAVDARRESMGMLRNRSSDDRLADPLAMTRAALTAEEWQATYLVGRSVSLEAAVTTAETWQSARS
jgi:hypothetical protein